MPFGTTVTLTNEEEVLTFISAIWNSPRETERDKLKLTTSVDAQKRDTNRDLVKLQNTFIEEKHPSGGPTPEERQRILAQYKDETHLPGYFISVDGTKKRILPNELLTPKTDEEWEELAIKLAPNSPLKLTIRALNSLHQSNTHLTTQSLNSWFANNFPFSLSSLTDGAQEYTTLAFSSENPETIELHVEKRLGPNLQVAASRLASSDNFTTFDHRGRHLNTQNPKDKTGHAFTLAFKAKISAEETEITELSLSSDEKTFHRQIAKCLNLTKKITLAQEAQQNAPADDETINNTYLDCLDLVQTTNQVIETFSLAGIEVDPKHDYLANRLLAKQTKKAPSYHKAATVNDTKAYLKGQLAQEFQTVQATPFKLQNSTVTYTADSFCEALAKYMHNPKDTTAKTGLDRFIDSATALSKPSSSGHDSSPDYDGYLRWLTNAAYHLCMFDASLRNSNNPTMEQFCINRTLFFSSKLHKIERAISG